jgi:hypothetical protein
MTMSPARSAAVSPRDEPAQLDEPGGDRTGHVTEPGGVVDGTTVEHTCHMPRESGHRPERCGAGKALTACQEF